MKRFPGYYRDAHGEEAVSFELEGVTYAVTIRGVRFSSNMLEDLEPDEDTPPECLASFTLFRNTLRHCEYRFSVPLTLIQDGQSEEVTLTVALQHAASSSLTVTLKTAHGELVAQDSDTYFETVLERLVAQLPPWATLRFCFSCRWGVVEPTYGLNGNFGCFRTQRETLLTAPTRRERVRLWPPPEWRQELDVCDDFTQR